MKKKVKVNFWGNMKFYTELKCYLFGYKNIGEYIEDLIIKDLQNPQDWVTYGLSQKFSNKDGEVKRIWNMLERGGKWELIKDDGNQIIPTGYVSNDMDIMLKFVAYMNFGVKEGLPDQIIEDLEFIRKK